MSRASTNKVSRDPLQTRKDILEIAFDEVYRHGFKATSTNTIIDKMKLTRGAFFHHFPTKDDLGFALIDEVLRGMIFERWILPVQNASDPIDVILRNFSYLIGEHRDEDLLCGCPLNNLVQEMADRPDFQRKIQSLMTLWIEETQKLLSTAKRSGHLKKETNTRELAEFIVACQESAFAMGKALNSRAAMQSMAKSLRRHLSHFRNGSD